MTRDELIAALQKCPENVEVIVDDPEYGLPTVIQSIGVPVPEIGAIDNELKDKIVINLIGEEYIPETRSDSQ